jgi:hypothetical protein
MTMTAAEEQTETPVTRYRDPVVEGFYGSVILAIEDGPDGASMAASITGEFHRHHQVTKAREEALTADVRRLSADDASKAVMLAHTGRSAVRLVEENCRMVGLLYHHTNAEERLYDLADQLESAHPDVAGQMREILSQLPAPAPAPRGPVVLTSAVDTRWHCGWFRRVDRPEDGPLEALPFCGWVLVAHDPFDVSQVVQAAFLYRGEWWTKTELERRGMTLTRMD